MFSIMASRDASFRYVSGSVYPALLVISNTLAHYYAVLVFNMKEFCVTVECGPSKERAAVMMHFRGPQAYF